MADGISGTVGFAVFLILIFGGIILASKRADKKDPSKTGKPGSGINPRVTPTNTQPAYPNTIFFRRH